MQLEIETGPKHGEPQHATVSLLARNNSSITCLGSLQRRLLTHLEERDAPTGKHCSVKAEERGVT